MRKMQHFAFDFNDWNRVPSLEKLSLIHVVVELWKEVNIALAILDKSWMFYARNYNIIASNHFKSLEDILHSRVQVRFHKLLQDKVLHFIRPIGLQMCEWLHLNWGYALFSNTRDFLNSISWTIHGNVDKFKSAELLVMKNSDFAVYRIACYYCIESEIHRIWSEAPLEVIIGFITLDAIPSDDLLLKYWICYAHNNLSLFMSIAKKSLLINIASTCFTECDFQVNNINELMTKISLLKGNSTAVKYFFNQIKNERKTDYILNLIELVMHCEIYGNYNESEEYFDIFYFLYSQLEEVCKIEMVRNYQQFFLCSMVKHCFFQNRMANIISLLGDFVDVDNLFDVLIMIINRILEGRYVLGCLLENLWHVTPYEIKREFFTYVMLNNRRMFMFEKNVHFLIRPILRDTNSVERNCIYSFFEL